MDLTSGRSIAYLADELFAMCSTFKAYAAAPGAADGRAGELKLDDAVRIDRADIVPNSPVTERASGAP